MKSGYEGISSQRTEDMRTISILTSKYSTRVLKATNLARFFFFFSLPNLEFDYICLRSLQSRETKQPFMPRKPFVQVPGKDRQPIQTNDGGTIWTCMTAVKQPKFSRKTEACRRKTVCTSLNSNVWKSLATLFVTGQMISPGTSVPT